MVSIASPVVQIIAPFDIQLGLLEQRHKLFGGKVLGNKNTASECDTGTLSGCVNRHAAMTVAGASRAWKRGGGLRRTSVPRW